MPAADIVAVADAIVAELNAHEFSQRFVAERGYLPAFELTELDRLKVTVVPKEDEGKLDTRSSSVHDYAIDIGIQKKPKTVENRDLDPLMLLAQEIADFSLFGKAPGNAAVMASSVRILYLQEHMLKYRQFTSVVTLTLRAWR